MEKIKRHTKLALIVGLLLDYIDELNLNNIWSRKVKSLGNNLRKEIKKYDDISMIGIDSDTSQEFVNGYQALSDLIDFNLSLNDKELESFSTELNALIEKYSKQ